MPAEAPYGSWKSPITADLITDTGIGLLEVAIDGDDIYWLEGRAKEAGRYTIMRRTPEGAVTEITPPDLYVRSTVHEYGGAAFTVSDRVVYFSNFRDQHLYRQRLGQQPELLTPTSGYRYADLQVDRLRRRIICIREDHTSGTEAVNTIVSLPLEGQGDGQIVVQGNNFYASPRISPDGSKLAYLTWNHPNMPWDGCELWLADIAPDGWLEHPQLVAGGPAESVFQPQWSPDGVLYFVAEPTGWWNIYRWEGDDAKPVHLMQAEFGVPQWVFGMSSYAFASPTRILCVYAQDGLKHLAWLDAASGELAPIHTDYTDISNVQAGRGFSVFIAGAPTEPVAVVRMDSGSGRMERLREAFEVTVDRGYFSIPEPITFPTDGDREAHAIYYPPANKDFTAPADERPPLIVMSHGGPTSATGAALRLGIQYWTSRGLAVLDVDYGGSTGYGREYRQRLNGNWGIVDVADCCNGALYLAKEGLADRNRLAIRGGSAGGYTTLACLTFRNDVFKAGASHFGISELEVFVKDTHKFESRYLYSLVGPYPARRDLYFDRSPINFTHKISAPLILFQGDEDKVVPPSQSQMMFEAALAKGLPVAYLLFKGEQHGFRKAENIKRSLEAELYFYGKIFGFAPADRIEPVEIQNLPAPS